MGSTPADRVPSSESNAPISQTSPQLNGTGRDRNMHHMEKQMDKDVDQVLRNWDQHVKKKPDPFRLRPLRSSATSGRLSSGRFSVLSREDSLPNTGGRYITVERVNESDSSYDAADEMLFDTSLESVEDDSVRKTTYSICPRTGRKVFRAQFDVQGFDLTDIKVKICGRKLIVFAIHKEMESGRQSTTEFCKKLKLPDDVNSERLECVFNSGTLTVEAPAITRSTSLSLLLERSGDIDQVNVPHIREGEVGKMLHLLVEIGSVFKANNVVVKLNGRNRLLVIAERKEENVYNRLTANLTREFDLADPIYPHSLKAGLTHDGILKVTARIQEEPLVLNSDENNHTDNPASSDNKQQNDHE